MSTVRARVITSRAVFLVLTYLVIVVGFYLAGFTSMNDDEDIEGMRRFGTLGRGLEGGRAW